MSPKAANIAAPILLPTLVGIVFGIFSQRYIGAWILLPAAIVAAVTILTRYHRLALASIAMASMVGWFAADISTPDRFTQLPYKAIRFSGTVSRINTSDKSRTFYVDINARIDTDTIRAIPPFKAKLTDLSTLPDVLPGDIINFKAEWRFPEERRLTGFPENDRTEYDYINGISLDGLIEHGTLEVAGKSGSSIYTLRRFSRDVADEILASGLSQPAGAFVAAITTGDTELLTTSQRQSMADAGVAHLLALSGAHMAVVAALLAALFFPFAAMGHRRLRWGATLAGIWIFAVSTGLSTSVVRSAIMASAILVALFAERPRSSLNNLCLAAIIILIFSPRSIYSAGFQLTFAAATSIVLLSSSLRPDFSRRLKWTRPIVSALSATVAATLATLPLVAYHFHAIPIWFIPANIVAIAIMPVMIVGGFLIAALQGLGIDSGWLASILNGSYDGFSAVTNLSSGATITGIWFPAWVMIPIYLAVALIFVAILRRNSRLVILATLSSVATIFIVILTHPASESEEMMIRGSRNGTEILLRQGSQIKIHSTGDRINFPADSLWLENACSDYLSLTGVSHIEYEQMRSDCPTRIIFCGKQLLIVPDSFTTVSGRKYDYALVTHTFKGDIAEYAMGLRADTILLSPDINRRRRQRYFRELTEAAIPVRDLVDTPFHLSK